jgi:hypothetical protein
MKFYAIDEEQIKQFEHIKKRLYSEMRMNGDEMRNSAQCISAIMRVVKELEIPEDKKDG